MFTNEEISQFERGLKEGIAKAEESFLGRQSRKFIQRVTISQNSDDCNTYAEIAFQTPEEQNIIISFWYDGTWKGFVENFWDYCIDEVEDIKKESMLSKKEAQWITEYITALLDYFESVNPFARRKTG